MALLLSAPPAWAQGTNDYDTDDDGLIEIDSQAKLNAIRYDIDGDGTAQSGSETDYAVGFPGVLSTQCPSSTCSGYELTTDLTLTGNWTPIGTSTLWFRTTFDGKGHTISGLTVASGATAGLFGYIGQFSGTTGHIRNLGVLGASVTAAADNDSAGAIVGAMGANTRLDASYASGGTVSAAADSTNIGGLVGGNTGGTIRASYSTNAVSISGTRSSNYLGGLVGSSTGTIVASYAAGTVATAANNTSGGLLGRSNMTTSTITDSYCDSAATGQTNCIGASEGSATATSTAYATSALQTPTDYAGTIYANWNLDLTLPADSVNDDPWDFGTASQYPALKFDTDGSGTATAYEFGVQGRPDPNPAPPPSSSPRRSSDSGPPYNPAHDHPEIYTNPRHQMATACEVRTTGEGDEEVSTSTLTFNLGTYTRPITLALSLWDGTHFRSLQSQNINMPELRQEGRMATVEVVTDPAQTRFRLDSQYGLNLVLGYADCHTDDP